MNQTEKYLQEQIAAKLRLMGDHYTRDYAKEQFLDNFSLLPGRGGCLLLQGIFLQLSGDERYREAMQQAEAFMFNKISTSDRLSPAFCDGLAGWGWLMIYLKEHGILQEFDDSILEEIDAAVAGNLDAMLDNGNYDLFYGTLGIGLYFLKRKKTLLVEKILRHLSDNAVKDRDEMKWIQFRPVTSAEPRYDLGLPHGITGILYFINKCYKENVLPALCETLLQQGIAFFLHNIQDEEKTGSFFPYWIATAKYDNGKNNPSRSRIAWCYGDLNILYTLLQVSRTVKDEGLEAAVVTMLLRTCERKAPAATDIEEAGFCHGTSGVAYIYLKLYRQTGIPAFKETADYWYLQTCDFGKEQGPAGYLFHSGQELGIPVSGILEGLGGVTLTFLAYLYPGLRENWDECLFLS